MIRVVLSLLVLLSYHSLALAGMGMGPGPGFKTYSGGSDPCSPLGSWGLYYDADHTSGTTTACISGGTTTVTFASVTADASMNTTVGGTYGVLSDGLNNHYVNVPATGITTENGRIEFKITTPSSLPATGTGLFEWGPAGGRVYVKLQYSASTYRILATHEDGSTISATSAYVSLSTSTPYLVTVDWNSTTGVLNCSIGATTATGSGTISAFSTPATGVRFGEDTGGSFWSSNIGFDDVYMGASQQ